MKQQRGVTISLGLPTLNEEATIGEIITVLKTALMDEVPLLDEIVVIDSDSTDRTVEIARESGRAGGGPPGSAARGGPGACAARARRSGRACMC